MVDAPVGFLSAGLALPVLVDTLVSLWAAARRQIKRSCTCCNGDPNLQTKVGIVVSLVRGRAGGVSELLPREFLAVLQREKPIMWSHRERGALAYRWVRLTQRAVSDFYAGLQGRRRS